MLAVFQPLRRAWPLLLLIGWLPLAGADEVRIAAAANFTSTMNSLKPLFEKQRGHQVVVSYGSTGKLYTQIINGAPFDILLSADDERPLQLEREGYSVPGSRFTYAVGQLTLWSSDPSLVDAKGHVLRGAHFTRLAIANPKTAPYGAAALEVLTALGLHQQVKPRLVQGDNIAQTWQFVATGNAQLGFVAHAQVIEANKGSWWQVPQSLYTPIRQDAVLLKQGAGNPAATAFLDFLRGSAARGVIERSGYAISDGSSR
jgi:molybdate transport system substrate-binding protein